MTLPFKKDDPLLFGFSKKPEGCISTNQAEGEHGPFFQIQKADAKGVVVTKDRGSDVNIVKVAERDVLSKLGSVNLLFNGSGEEGNFMTISKYTPLFWDVSGYAIFANGIASTYRRSDKNTLKVTTTNVGSGTSSLFQAIGSYVSDYCDNSQTTYNSKSLLFYPYYTLSFNLLNIVGTWAAAIVVRTDNNTKTSIVAQIEISESDLYVGILDEDPDIPSRNYITNIKHITWERDSSQINYPLYGVMFYPLKDSGGFLTNECQLEIDEVQLTPTNYLTTYNAFAWGDRWLLWFSADTSQGWDGYLYNSVNTQDGYDLPYNYFVDYIQARFYSDAGMSGTHTVTAHKNTSAITDGTNTLEITTTSSGMYYDHEHFSLDAGGTEAAGCRSLSATLASPQTLNVYCTAPVPGLETPADRVVVCLSGYRIR